MGQCKGAASEWPAVRSLDGRLCEFNARDVANGVCGSNYLQPWRGSGMGNRLRRTSLNYLFFNFSPFCFEGVVLVVVEVVVGWGCGGGRGAGWAGGGGGGRGGLTVGRGGRTQVECIERK